MTDQQNPRAFGIFLREFLRDPRAIGALAPSSAALARQMAALVPAGKGPVIELGPGVGPVTRALLQAGIPGKQLILVERSASLVLRLRQEFPELTVIHGDAGELSRLIKGYLPARAIVSSLPLRSIPPTLVAKILAEFPKCARPGTAYIQFTYHPKRASSGLSPHFHHDRRYFVWRNLPPARVDRYLFQGNEH